MSDWETLYFCVSCDTQISFYDRLYSGGRCIHCGFKHPSAVTIVETNERAGRWIKTETPWWQFWRENGYYELKEETNE